MRKKIESKPTKIWSGTIQKAVGLSTALVLVIFVVLQTSNGTGDFNLDLIESITYTLEETDNDEFNDFVDLRYSDTELFDIYSEMELKNYSSNLNMELALNNDELYDFTNYSYLGVDGISGLSESEEFQIYSSLIDKKIL